MSGKFRFSIDRGGTFTDVYAELPNGQVRVMKLLSRDTANYPDAPREGIRRILRDYYKQQGKAFPSDDANKEAPIPTEEIEWIRMGTTVATNALLERDGFPFLFVTTRGLGDILEIGNQSRSFIFDLQMRKPLPLYENVVEAHERIRMIPKDPDGGEPAPLFHQGKIEKCDTGEYIEIIEPLDETHIQQQLQQAYDQGYRSMAVALLHSYCFPRHEKRIGEIAKEIGFDQVSLSSEIMPMIRLVPRGQTSCVDAYLTPLITEYLRGFISGFDQHMAENTDISFMMSDGGLCPMENFHGFRAILSGPAGGVVGYARSTPAHGAPVIGFDMGGTSTDVSRYHGSYSHVYDTQTAGVTIQAPQLDIQTVAAGGGSKLQFRAGMMQVGPGSVGAQPGPVCYRKGGTVPSVTDANVVLGRLQPDYFPHIFGDDEKQPLDKEASQRALGELAKEINKNTNSSEQSAEEVAFGFIQVANEAMCRPIRAITEARGFSAANHILSCFGGAGGQHACAIARRLGMNEIFIHRHSGILSAYGLGLADMVFEKQEAASLTLTEDSLSEFVSQRFTALQEQVQGQLKEKGFTTDQQSFERFLNLRYSGTDTSLMVLEPESADTKGFRKSFEEHHKQEFGFTLEREVLVDDIRVRATGQTTSISSPKIPSDDELPQAKPVGTHDVYFQGGFQSTPAFNLSDFGSGATITGPAMILNETSTLLIEPHCTATITEHGDVHIKIDDSATGGQVSTALDNTLLAVFAHRFMSIAEEMGRTLRRTSISTNIKERLDFSCALFSPDGGLVANAPHLPVHLGSMQRAVSWQIRHLGENWNEGDVIVTNHPAAGGSHLPDITVITPVFSKGKAVFFVASRGHHADIGGITPGSMPPFSHFLYEEGAAIKSFKLVDKGQFQEEGITKILQNPNEKHGITGTRNLSDNLSDLRAQIAANQKGIRLVSELIEEYSLEVVHAYMDHVQNQAEEAVRQMLVSISHKRGLKEKDTIHSLDYMDDGSPLRLALTIDRNERTATFDWTGTAPQTFGNWNAPHSITYSAIIYSLRCLVSEDIPLNQGCLNPITIKLPKNSLLEPSDHAAVVGGNVLTSQRITDVILQAFGECADSQGCMNNLTFGNARMGYYETIAGGAGAGPTWDGVSAVHSHMTNTRITDAEIFELRYPVLLREFSVRRGSGGKGKHAGGDGVNREIEFLEELEMSILSERRSFAPCGSAGGEPGARGVNHYLRCLNEKENEYQVINLGGKNTVQMNQYDRVRIMSPGGGGFGTTEEQE